MERRLARDGVNDIRQSVRAPPARRRHRLGRHQWRPALVSAPRRRPARQADAERASIGHSHVLSPNKRGLEPVRLTARRLALKAASRLRRKGYRSRLLVLHVRFEDDKAVWQCSRKLAATQDSFQVLAALDSLFPRLAEEGEAPPRRLARAHGRRDAQRDRAGRRANRGRCSRISTPTIRWRARRAGWRSAARWTGSTRSSAATPCRSARCTAGGSTESAPRSRSGASPTWTNSTNKCRKLLRRANMCLDAAPRSCAKRCSAYEDPPPLRNRRRAPGAHGLSAKTETTHRRELDHARTRRPSRPTPIELPPAIKTEGSYRCHGDNSLVKVTFFEGEEGRHDDRRGRVAARCLAGDAERRGRRADDRRWRLGAVGHRQVVQADRSRASPRRTAASKSIFGTARGDAGRCFLRLGAGTLA